MTTSSDDSPLPAAAPGSKRRRVDDPPSPKYDIEDGDDYVPYVPVAQRRQAKLAAASRSTAAQRKLAQSLEEVNEPSPDDEAERQKERERKERTLLVEAQEVHRKKAAEGTYAIHPLTHIPSAGITQKANARQYIDAKKTDIEKSEEADAAILAAIASRRKLASDLELAKGIQYTNPIETSYVTRTSFNRARYADDCLQMESPQMHPESTSWHR